MKNKMRTMKRERQKQLQQRLKSGGALPLDNDDGSLEPSIEKATGTTRRCANCGAKGHIKTNKK